MPPLIKGYLRIGGKVSYDSFVDYKFNTIDLCVIVTTDKIDEKYNTIVNNNIANNSVANNIDAVEASGDPSSLGNMNNIGSMNETDSVLYYDSNNTFPVDYVPNNVDTMNATDNVSYYDANNTFPADYMPNNTNQSSNIGPFYGEPGFTNQFQNNQELYKLQNGSQVISKDVLNKSIQQTTSSNLVSVLKDVLNNPTSAIPTLVSSITSNALNSPRSIGGGNDNFNNKKKIIIIFILILLILNKKNKL